MPVSNTEQFVPRRSRSATDDLRIWIKKILLISVAGVLISGVVIFTCSVYSYFGMLMPLHFITFQLRDQTYFNFLLGIIVVTISVFGMCAIFLQEAKMIKLMCVGLAVVTILAVSCLIELHELNQVDIKENRKEAVNRAFLTYSMDVTSEKQVDSIQIKLKCCGITSYMDWIDKASSNCSQNQTENLRCRIPNSCCVMKDEGQKNDSCGDLLLTILNEKIIASNFIYTDGCQSKITDLLETTIAEYGLCSGILLAAAMVTLFVSIIFIKLLKVEVRNMNTNEYVPLQDLHFNFPANRSLMDPNEAPER